MAPATVLECHPVLMRLPKFVEISKCDDDFQWWHARTVLIVAVGLTLNIQLSADIFLRIAGFLSQLADIINKKGIFHTVPPCQIVIIADFGCEEYPGQSPVWTDYNKF